MRRIRIGFHGVPGAGKTVLQAMLYGFRDLGDGTILITDASTIQYLRPRWDQIRNQSTPAASAMGKPDRLLMTIKTEATECEIETQDFAGALIEPVGNDLVATELAEEVHSFLAGCDGLCLLFDPSNPDPRQLDAIEVLLNSIRVRRRARNGHLLPVAFVLTKFDKLGPIDSDPRTNQLRAEEFLEQPQILKLIGDYIARERKRRWWYRIFPTINGCYRIEHDRFASGEWFRVFAVSAFGIRCQDGSTPPFHQLKPYNIHEPLRWLVREADAEMERADIKRRRHHLKIAVISLITAVALLLIALGFDKIIDHRLWRHATAADRSPSTDYRATRDLYRKWLRVPLSDSSRRDLASAAIRRLELKWDRQQYEKLYISSNTATTWQEFDAAIKEAEAYVGSDRKTKRMSGAVNGFLHWKQAIQSGNAGWHVGVAAAPKYFPALSWFFGLFGHSMSFAMDLNKQSFETSSIDDGNAAANLHIGFFKINWGDPLEVRGELAVYNTDRNKVIGSFGFIQSFHSPAPNTLGIQMSGNGSGIVILKLRCEGLAPPAMPPYETQTNESE